MNFSPNKMAVEVVREGAFGGTYFRNISSDINEKWYKKITSGINEKWYKNS